MALAVALASLFDGFWPLIPMAILLLLNYGQRQLRGEDVLKTAKSPTAGQEPPPLPGLPEKLAAMAKFEQQLARAPGEFRYDTWRLALWGHFGPAWLIFLIFSLIAWGLWTYQHGVELGQPWVAAAIAVAILGPGWWLATSRREAVGEEAPAWRKLAKGELADVPDSSWGVLAAGIGALLLIPALTAQPAGATLRNDHPLWFGLIILAFALKLSGLFPAHQSLTDRVFEVTPQRCPRIFALVQEAAAAARLPLPRRIYLAHDSSLAQVDVYRSRSDLLKGRVAELRLGLRHLLILGQDELRALVSHELRHQAHGSALRSALFTLIPRLRQRGQELGRPKLLEIAEELELRLCCLLRTDERESDRASADRDGPTAARMLARVHAFRVAFTDFWNDLDAFILRHPSPPGGPREIERLLTLEPDFPRRLRAAYAEALLYVTLPGASHPELADRLKAIGQPAPAQLDERPTTPAEELLDDDARAFLRRIEQEWVSSNREGWQKRQADLSGQAKLLDTPKEEYLGGSSEELTSLSNHLWTLRSPAAACPVLEVLHAAKPKDERTGFWVRVARFEQDTPGAEEDLLAYARGNARYRHGLARVAIRRKLAGKDDEAAALWMEYLVAGNVLERDEKERNLLQDDDPILAHAVPAEDLARLKGVCVDYGVIRMAHLSRRRLRHIPTPHEHVVIVKFDVGTDGRYRADFEKHQTAAKEALKAAWSGAEGALWVIEDTRMPSLAHRTRSLPGARLHG